MDNYFNAYVWRMDQFKYQYKTFPNSTKEVDAATLVALQYSDNARCLVNALQAMAWYPKWRRWRIYGAQPASMQVKHKSENEYAIGMINQAIETSDTDYVRSNWQGFIAKSWQNLTQQQTESLNLLYNGG